MGGFKGMVLVTGGTGFVGQSLTKKLLASGWRVRITGLETVENLDRLGAELFQVGDLGGAVAWDAALDGVDVVVHLAAIAHRFETQGDEYLDIYDRVNHQATRSLVEAVSRNPRVRRFLFVSSVRVHGDAKELPVRESSPLAPTTPYDLSKMNAEFAVRELLEGSSLCWSILRPVLVYGPGNRGNMGKLEGLLKGGLPLPLSSRPNRRSFLYVGNLVDAIRTYIEAKNPSTGRTWLVADAEPVSTEKLFTAMGAAMGCNARVLHCPYSLLSAAASVGDAIKRIGLPNPWTHEVFLKLSGDFFVDIGAIRRELAWNPPYSLDQAIQLTYGNDLISEDS